MPNTCVRWSQLPSEDWAGYPVLAQLRWGQGKALYSCRVAPVGMGGPGWHHYHLGQGVSPLPQIPKGGCLTYFCRSRQNVPGTWTRLQLGERDRTASCATLVGLLQPSTCTYAHTRCDNSQPTSTSGSSARRDCLYRWGRRAGLPSQTVAQAQAHIHRWH